MVEDLGRIVPSSIDVATAEGTSRLFVLPEVPFWFVPSPQASDLLHRALKQGPRTLDDLVVAWRNLSGLSLADSMAQVKRLMTSVVVPDLPPYRGRSQVGPPSALRELWIHVTDKCNLRCRHCLFGHHLTGQRHLPWDGFERAVHEAASVGLRLVAFTGGEPFCHSRFPEMVRYVLENTTAHVAILTNAVSGRIGKLRGMDPGRLHLQVSLEGPEEVHDGLRGQGSFRRAIQGVREAQRLGISVSAAVALNPATLPTLSLLPSICRENGIDSIHLQFHFERGFGAHSSMGLQTGEPEGLRPLLEGLHRLREEARRLSIRIDNFDAMASRLFSPPGTRYDLGNACWEALALGPDGALYPTPAMVDLPQAQVGHIEEGLVSVWLDSPKAKAIRSLSLLDSPEMAADPLRFIVGGGDLDHALKFGEDGGPILGSDPYLPVYHWMIKRLLEEELADLPVAQEVGMVLRMGEVSEVCGGEGQVNFVRCNCLLSLGQGVSGLVKEFYASRARKPDITILNPVERQGEEFSLIPKEVQERSYGCGSPVDAARLEPGEVVVDLGCGAGMECLLAAQRVGPGGEVIGVDMTAEMLGRAKAAARQVAERVGYANSHFVQGRLESLPLADGVADVVISNCVINLCRNKRRVLKEALRVLRPGGRLVVADVVTEEEPPPSIRANQRLLGECLGGAMVQSALLAMLEELGFVAPRVISRFPYREVKGHPFYSLTFEAYRPQHGREKIRVMGGGPELMALLPGEGVLSRGEVTEIEPPPGFAPERLADRGILILDENGALSNVAGVGSCCCCSPQPDQGEKRAEPIGKRLHQQGCLICGAPVEYLSVPEQMVCELCGRSFSSSARCRHGHHVCDGCHTADPLKWLEQKCLSTGQTDLIALMKEIRLHPSFSLHGPEHHAMVPGVIMAVYRNLGGSVGEREILAAIQRGAQVPGGMCGLAGACGAAIGAGIAFGLILDSSPLTPGPRTRVSGLVGGILQEIGAKAAARCCQRESYLALAYSSRVSKEMIGIHLPADDELHCAQYGRNRECIGRACELFPATATNVGKGSDTSPLFAVGGIRSLVRRD